MPSGRPFMCAFGCIPYQLTADLGVARKANRVADATLQVCRDIPEPQRLSCVDLGQASNHTLVQMQGPDHPWRSDVFECVLLESQGHLQVRSYTSPSQMIWYFPEDSGRRIIVFVLVPHSPVSTHTALPEQ